MRSLKRVKSIDKEFMGVIYDPRNPYLLMSDEEVEGLPRFHPDGSVAMYDIGDGYLLGKDGLKRFRGVVRAKEARKSGG